MLNRIQKYQSQIFSGLIGLFFILILHFKLSYSLIPILCAVAGLVFLFPQIRQKRFTMEKETKLLVITFVFYFILFVISFIIHKGKANELDLPSRVLLLLPILALFNHIKLKQQWISFSIIIAGLIAGVVALIQVFGFNLKIPFPRHMKIQAGDIAMSISMFCFAVLFYFYAQKKKLWVILSLVAGLSAMIGSFLTQARGGWIGVPAVLLIIFVLNRKLLSKWILIGILGTSVIGSLFAGSILVERFNTAQREVALYVDKNNGSTSLGARFDMWKSALIGIQEKPIFGWGLQGVKQMREEHFKQKYISKMASKFDHAHNQYLQDGSARGILGLIALLGVFFVPLTLFVRNMKQASSGSLVHLWGVLGITHIVSIMIYCLSQSFFAHNSGVMFYFFTVILFYGLQKNVLNKPLATVK